MFKIYIKRTCAAKVPFPLYVETNEDWTHFSHLHRKTVKGYRLLWKQGQREIFLYKARRLYPLPFFDDYIVFRNYEPAQYGYRNVYLNVRSGLAQHLSTTVVADGDFSRLVSEFMFCLPAYWRPFPRLFLWAFKRRMRKIMDEDNQWMYQRLALGLPKTQEACAPKVPGAYDLFDDMIAGAGPAGADVRYEYSIVDAGGTVVEKA